MTNTPDPTEAAPITTIAEYNEHDQAIAVLREKYSRRYDCAKSEEMTEARKARSDLVGRRTALEEKRKELKAPLIAHGKKIDAEASRIEQALLELETPIDAAIKVEEKRKEEAKAQREAAKAQRAELARAKCSEIRGVVIGHVGASSVAIAAAMATLREANYNIAQEGEEQHAADVEAARLEVLGQLDKMHRATLDQEAVQKKIAADRAKLEQEQRHAEELRKADELAAAAERTRIANEQQAAKEKIAAEERASEQRRADADRKAAAERERLAKEAATKQAAEDKRIAEERAKLDAERKAAEDKSRKEREAAEAKKRADDEVAEAKKRDAERAALKRMDGFALLRSFVERFGDDPEFAPVASHIAAWLNTQEAKPVKKVRTA